MAQSPFEDDRVRFKNVIRLASLMILNLLLSCSLAAAAEPSLNFVFIPRCRAKDKQLCGAAHLEAGWKKIATCSDGHEWHYLIKKEKKQLHCWGINERGGPAENPCKGFRGDLQEFKKCGMFKGREFKITEP